MLPFLPVPEKLGTLPTSRTISQSASSTAIEGSETHQSTANEQERYGDVLEILCRPRPSPTREMLKENIGDSIDKDEQTFKSLHGQRAIRFPRKRICRDFEIPGPAQPRKAANEAEHG